MVSDGAKDTFWTSAKRTNKSLRAGSMMFSRARLGRSRRPSIALAPSYLHLSPYKLCAVTGDKAPEFFETWT